MVAAEIYEPAMDHEGNWYPKGPGRGLSYYGGYLFPEVRCKSFEEASQVCRFMNLAFEQGRQRQIHDVKQVLGL